MADQTAPAPVPPVPTLPGLAQDALHYLAGAGLLALAAWATQQSLLDKQVLSTLIAGAAIGVGFKLKG